MSEKEHDSKSKLTAISELVKGKSIEEICSKWEISVETLEKWKDQFCSRVRRVNELPKEEESPEREEVKRSDILAVYGSYTNMMEAQVHFDQLSYSSETEVSSANWYAITAVLVIFSFSSKEYHLSLILSIIVGLVDLSYLTSRFIIAIIKNERAGSAYFFNAIKMENNYEWLPPLFHSMFTKGVKKDKEGNGTLRKISYHGSPFMKAFFYVANLSVPFILIFPSLYQLESFDTLHVLKKIHFMPLYASYSIVGVLAYAVYIAIILRFIRPFMSWLVRMEEYERED